MAAPFTLRGVIVLWSGITLVYLVAVTHRLLWLHTPPGLATFAAVSAVLAVWLELFAIRSARALLDVGVASALFASVVMNTAIIAGAVVQSKRTVLPRAGFAVLLLIVLFWKTHNLVDRFNRKAGNEKRITH